MPQTLLAVFRHSSLNQQYKLRFLCVLVHLRCIAVFRPFTDSALNQKYRFMLLVHLCTLCAPSESSLNQLEMLLAL